MKQAGFSSFEEAFACWAWFGNGQYLACFGLLRSEIAPNLDSAFGPGILVARVLYSFVVCTRLGSPDWMQILFQNTLW